MAKPSGTQKIHPGKRRRNPDFTKNEKPRIKGWSFNRLQESLSKAKTRRKAARFRIEILRRFPTTPFTQPSFDKE